jgi:rod shape determining protein RodA
MNRLIVGPQTPVTRIRRATDWVVVTIALLLIILGAINLNSAGSGDWSGAVRGQLGFVAVGGLAMVITASIDYRVYYRLAYPIYGVGVGLVALVLLVGTQINNATRWLNLQLFMFQPSEVAKLVVVIVIARYIHDVSQKEVPRWRVTLPAMGMALLPAGLIVRQPDLSTGIVLILLAASMLAVLVMRPRGMVATVLGGAIALAVAWRFLMEGYQIERINVWLEPEAYPEAGGYQILQARTAVGNGGFLGRGVGQGTQNVLDFVPYKASDFSFAVFAEEWGFLGSIMLIGLFLMLVMWAINIASQARDRFAAGLCVGIAALVFWHAVLNMGVVLEFFPNTGLPLPFFSQGGSNVLTIMASLGILMSVSRSRKWR